MNLHEISKRIKFWKDADRIGPDIPWSHWRLHFRSTMFSLCQKKFKYFHDTAEIRPGSYFIACSKISLGQRVVIRPGSILEADPREGEHGIVIEDDELHEKLLEYQDLTFKENFICCVQLLVK